MAYPKGGPKVGGRKKGTPNKATAAVKEMVIEALNRAGGVEYLAARAKDQPSAFMTLVGKVLPLQVTGDPDAPIVASSTIKVEGLSADQLRALASIPVQSE